MTENLRNRVIIMHETVTKQDTRDMNRAYVSYESIITVHVNTAETLNGYKTGRFRRHNAVIYENGTVLSHPTSKHNHSDKTLSEPQKQNQTENPDVQKDVT